MRVKISYGMEIEDVPSIAENLGYDAQVELKEAISRLRQAVDNIEESANNYELVLAMLEKTRKQLTKADLIIIDLEAILEGLHNYYNGEQNVSERRPIVDPGGNPTAETEDTGEG